MSSFPINSFKFGLDTRRDVLTSLPGTLVTCENCHINPGGEIEKRKAFGDIVANTDVLDSPGGATGTFGIEVTEDGIVVFGSARDFDDVYVSATGVASVAIKGSGTGATFDITANSFGAITAAVVNAGGTGYVVGDILTLTTARGTEARLTIATLSGSAVATVTITNNGNEQAEPFLASALVGVTYQQLRHPSLVNDTTEDYVAANHRMTACVFSENFNGKAFACAQFDDDRRFLYYDGELVQHSANGIVMEGRTALSDLAVDVLRQFEAIGWSGFANRTTVPVTITNVTVTATVTYNGHGLVTGDLVEIRGATQTQYNGTFIITRIDDNSFTYVMPTNPGGSATGSPTATVLQNGATLIKSPIGESWSGVLEENADAGQIGIKTELTSGFSYSGISAQAAFQITVNTGTFALTAPENSDQTGIADLTGEAVSAKATATLTALAIVSAVNDLTFVHGYTASSNADIVAIFAPEVWGNFTGNLTITTTTGTVVASSSGTTLALTLFPSGVVATARYAGGYQNVPFLAGTSVRASGRGGTPNYRFAWTEKAPVVGRAIRVVTQAGGGVQNTFADVFFILDPPVGETRLVPFSITATFTCVLTDSAAGSDSKEITIVFNGLP